LDKLLWLLASRFCDGRRKHLASSRPTPSCAGIGRAGVSSGAGSPAPAVAGPHERRSARVDRQDVACTITNNHLWGIERIRGELLKLGIVVSNRSIRRYRWRGPARSRGQTWRTLLRNHAHHLWAADLLTVPTLTFKTLYVLVLIAHGRRDLVHVNVTASPTAFWGWGLTNNERARLDQAVRPDAPTCTPGAPATDTGEVGNAVSVQRPTEERTGCPAPPIGCGSARQAA